MSIPPQVPRRFFVADLGAQGDLRSQEEYRYEELEQIPGAAELIVCFATLIWRDPEEFAVLVPGSTNTRLRWRACAPTAGIATLWYGNDLATLSFLASGLDPTADFLTLRAFQQRLVSALHDTGHEPSFDLMSISERPLLATINIAEPDQQADRLAVALADRCFAAAYFRVRGLA